MSSKPGALTSSLTRSTAASRFSARWRLGNVGGRCHQRRWLEVWRFYFFQMFMFGTVVDGENTIFQETEQVLNSALISERA